MLATQTLPQQTRGSHVSSGASPRSVLVTQSTERPEAPLKKPALMPRDETSFILRKCLRPEHATDPNVMRFIANYLDCREISQAARAAGLKPSDGRNLLKRPDIHEAIRQITERAVFKDGFDAGEVIERVKEIMRTDPADLQNDDGSFKESLKDVPPELRRGIKKFKAKNIWGVDPNGMKVITGSLIEVEFWDKMKAVELLGREKEIFKEKHTVTHEIAKNMSDTLLESRERALEMAKMREVGETAIFREAEE